jgi:hypothetical protein
MQMSGLEYRSYFMSNLYGTTANVLDQQVVADTSPAFSTAGSWTPGFNLGGYSGDVKFSPAGDGSSTATWTFAVVPGQTYNLSATWTAWSNRATNAPYTIASGGTTLGTATVNQQNAPSGFTLGGVTWQGLGTFVATGSILTVTLSNNANGYVIADDMLLQLVAPKQVVDDSDPAWTTTGPWIDNPTTGLSGDIHYTAAGDGSDTATWTFAVVPGQTYSVSATWTSGANRATDAPFTIASGGTSLGTVPVDQQKAPSGFTLGGVTWQGLETFVATGSILTVTLSNDANGFVISDGILLQPVTPSDSGNS